MHGASSTADAGAGAGFDAEGALALAGDVRELAARLVGPRLIVFPVRHHSPACAWHLRKLLDGTRPSAILVEGPRSFSPLIAQLADERARMPLAFYSYAVVAGSDDAPPQRHAAYYPFCDHSPELVALRHAAAHGLPAEFIDLDLADQSPDEQDDDEEEARSLLDERHYLRSRYLPELASRLGCRDHEELWEHLFEAGAARRSLTEHVGAIAAYCHLARVDVPEEDLRRDATLDREAEMAWHVQQALARRHDGDGPVLAVVGGFHATAIVQRVEAGSARPKLPSRAVTEQASALIRYAFERLDRLNGYSAGMVSPAWHQQLWERTLKHERAGVDLGVRIRRDTALAFLLDIAQQLRERGVALPMPAVGAAYDQSLQLAALRNREAPAREDVLDAITSCFIKGDADADGALVRAACRKVFTGDAVGQVPPGTDVPPLVRDFQARARRQKLKIDDAEPRRVRLDIYRRPDHRTTSRLLHGLSLLGVPFAMRTAGPDFTLGMGMNRLHEHWQYSYSVATEASLVEASVHGSTVPLAVATRFSRRIQRLESGEDPHDAHAAAALLVQACVLGLHDHVARVARALATAIAGEADFAAASSAAGTISLLWEAREPLEAKHVDELPSLLRAAYDRALYLGSDMQATGGDGDGIVAALLRLRELLGGEAGAALDASLYWALVESGSTRHVVPLIRGAATGLLFGAGRVTAEELGTAVSGHLGGLASTNDSVAFLRGLLKTAREAAWQQRDLLRALDGLLASWTEDVFVAALPELRLAFAEMTPRETERIADAVAALHGRDDLGPLARRDRTAEEVQANLQASLQAIDLLNRDGLAGWMRT